MSILIAASDRALTSQPPDLGTTPVEIAAEVPDWSSERKRFFSWHPSRSLLASIRSYQRHAKSHNPLRILARRWAELRHRFWSVITGADISIGCEIGGGLLLPHPNGVVINADVRIGPNCLIFQQVTIGTRTGSSSPVIGGHVDIGAGAKILGEIRIGDHVCIGANAVVLMDLPAWSTAVGVPAVITRVRQPG